MTEILQNAQVFARRRRRHRRRRRQSYDNTSSFSSKTAELIRGLIQSNPQPDPNTNGKHRQIQ